MAEIDYSQVTGLVHSTESFGSVYGKRTAAVGTGGLHRG